MQMFLWQLCSSIGTMPKMLAEKHYVKISYK